MFPTEDYAKNFGNLPTIDGTVLRQKTAEYVKEFPSNVWYQKPIHTYINGESLQDGDKVDTVDAFNRVNGKQIIATKEVVDKVISHVHNYICPKNDWRKEMREIDSMFMRELAPIIVGNQCMDFEKQDGITEIEESVEANCVEQRLNDKLYDAEQNDGTIIVRRNPVFVGCVSNFSNFLDLCRKCLRHIEIGVPVVVFSRSNTTQHMFRWFVLLQEEMGKRNVDLGLVTYLSCTVAEQRRVMTACPDSPMHFTGSREIAQKIKEVCPKLMASTGGPNTMVTTGWNDHVGNAARCSNLIENKGQCTAMRHLVTDCGITDAQINEAWSCAPPVASGVEAVEMGEFAGIFKTQHKSGDPDQDTYKTCADQPNVNYKLSADLPVSIKEHWRQVFLDVTAPAKGALRDPVFLKELADWLNREQPISLAVNSETYDLADTLFETTGMVVYTIGTLSRPALTAQARPQDGEVFGEFPPRSQMKKVTQFPMLVPSPVASYNAVYKDSVILEAYAQEQTHGGHERLKELNENALKMLSYITKDYIHGYAIVLLEYLMDSCKPKVGGTVRTALYGLQRPPIGTVVVLRVESPDYWDRLLLYLVLFAATNAHTQVEVSASGLFSKNNLTMLEQLRKHTDFSTVVVEDKHEFEERTANVSKVYNGFVVDGEMEAMLGFQFVGRLFPLGHIKSVKPDDKEFIDHFSKSKKWLRMREK